MKFLRGFTLVEMAIVLFLIGITMSMGLKMVTATLDNGAYSETKSKQERIKMALIGYLRTNGNLPCPDSSSNISTGLASSAVPCTASATDPAANNGYGVVPWLTLGLSRDTVQDGWGNYFTYRVANGVSSKNWTLKTGFDINELTSPHDALTIQEPDATGTLVDTTKQAVVVILSHGKNGFGAKTVKVPSRMAITGAGTGETTNATTGSSTFVRRPVAADGAYDDVVAYMTPQDLLQPLVTEGTLKACIAYCPPPPSTSNCTATGSCSCDFGAGVAGKPVSGVGCTGECTTCTAPAITAPCAASGIPIGSATATCP